MFTFYLFSFIPVIAFSLMLWSDVHKKGTFGRRPFFLLLSLIFFLLTGLTLLLEYFNLTDKTFAFAHFCLLMILYQCSFFLLEYSVHNQRIVKSFLLKDFHQKIRSFNVLLIIMLLIFFISLMLYLNREPMLQKIARGIFKNSTQFGLVHGIVAFIFVLFFIISNINIKNNIFNLQRGVIRREDVLFNSLIIMSLISIVVFYGFNGFGIDEAKVLFGLESLKIKSYPFELLLVLNVVYAIRLYAEYFFRRIYNHEKTIQKQGESVELKNYLINLVLSSPIEEDINIIKSTIKDSLDRSMRNLVVTEYRITGTYILRRTDKVLRVDSKELINGFCIPLTILGGTNVKKKSTEQLIDIILKKSFDLEKIESTPMERLQDWGDQLIKQILTTGKEVIVDNIPRDFLGMQRFIGLFPVISSDRLDGVIVVFKEFFEELFPEEHNVLEDLIDDMKIIFSITQGKRVQTEKNRLQGEMDAARALQTAMVPKKIEVKGYDVACYMETATEVGGDAYDYFCSKNGNYFGIGDVSGHGLPAGLMALIQQAAFQSALYTAEQANYNLQPYELYNVVNKVLYLINTKRIGSDKFMTQNYLHEENGNFTHAGAHEIALLYNEKEEKMIELADFTKKTAFMGFSPAIDSKTSIGNFKMEEHDLLVLYSDGIIEAKDHYSHQYGLENLKHLIETNMKLSCMELIEKIVESVKKHAESGDRKLYGGKLADDITLLVIKKLPETI